MRTKEEMYVLVDEWLSSEQTQREYCKEVGIKPSTFSYWVSKRKESSTASLGFIKVDTRSSLSSAVIEICYPNGVKLTLGRSDLSLVSQLIRLY